MQRASTAIYLAMAQLLYEERADVNRVDQDGTAPVHSAACNGHLHVLKFLSQIGVNMEARGAIIIGDDWKNVLRNATHL